MGALTLLLVEDSPLFRTALVNILGQNKRTKIRTRACSSSSFLGRIATISEDAVMIDAVTWLAGLQALVSSVEQASMIAPVLLLGREDLLGKHMQALHAGAVGFVKQTAPLRVITEAVRTVSAGGVWFERQLSSDS